MSGTKVKISGFQLTFSDNIKIGEVYQQLERFENQEIKLSGGRNGIYLVDTHENYICGILITFRDDKKSVATKRDEDGNLKVIKSELRKDEHASEASVFFINPITKSGLFYSYFGGSNAAALSKIFSNAHKNARKYAIKSYIDEKLSQSKSKDKSKFSEKANSLYGGKFKLTIMVTPKDIKSLLSEFEEINTIEVKADGLIDNVSEFSPLISLHEKPRILTKIAKQFRRKAHKEVEEVAKKLGGLSYDDLFKVIGKSFSGEELSRKVGDNTSEFGIMGYDDYIDKLPDDTWTQYKFCAAHNGLQAKMVKYSAVFGVPGSTQSWKIVSAKDLGG